MVSWLMSSASCCISIIASTKPAVRGGEGARAHDVFERLVGGLQPDVAELRRVDLLALCGVGGPFEHLLGGVHPFLVGLVVPLDALGEFLVLGDGVLDGVRPGLDEGRLGLHVLLDGFRNRLVHLFDHLGPLLLHLV